MHGSANKLSSRVALSASLLSLGAALGLASPALADGPAEGAVKSLAPIVKGPAAPTRAAVTTVATEAVTPAPAAPAAATRQPLAKVVSAPAESVLPREISKTVTGTLNKVTTAAPTTVAKTVTGTVTSTVDRVTSTIPTAVAKTVTGTVTKLTTETLSSGAATVAQTALRSTVTQASSTVSGALAGTTTSSLAIVGRTSSGAPELPEIRLPGDATHGASPRVKGTAQQTINHPVGATQEAPAPAAAGGAPGGPLAAGQLSSAPSAEALDSRSSHMPAPLPTPVTVAPQNRAEAFLGLPGTASESVGGHPSGSASDSPAGRPFSPQPGPGGAPSGAGGAPAGPSGGLDSSPSQAS